MSWTGSGGGSTPLLDYSVFDSVIDAITAHINVAGIISVLVGVIPVALAFIALWWGVRKASQIVFSAFRKGKLNI